MTVYRSTIIYFQLLINLISLQNLSKSVHRQPQNIFYRKITRPAKGRRAAIETCSAVTITLESQENTIIVNIYSVNMMCG